MGGKRHTTPCALVAASTVQYHMDNSARASDAAVHLEQVVHPGADGRFAAAAAASRVRTGRRPAGVPGRCCRRAAASSENTKLIRMQSRCAGVGTDDTSVTWTQTPGACESSHHPSAGDAVQGLMQVRRTGLGAPFQHLLPPLSSRAFSSASSRSLTLLMRSSSSSCASCKG